MLTHWNETDIENMLKGVGGVACSHAAETGFGVIDDPSNLALKGHDTNQLEDGGIVLTVRTNAFPTLSIGDSITAGGTPYTVHGRAKSGDGALTELHCEP